MALSRNQLDKLGERLKAGDLGGDDLRMLDEYRRSFAATSSVVMQILRNDFGLAPTARPAKSTAAIVEKLRRLSTQLTRLQDIAGCRVVVEGLEHQQSLVVGLCQLVPALSGCKSGRSRGRAELRLPSHACCRQVEGRWAEIQVRTELQHLWAMLSEKVADRFGHALKYGGGDEAVRARMVGLSDAAYHVDFVQHLVRLATRRLASGGDEELLSQLAAEQADLERDRRALSMRLQQVADNPDAVFDET